MIEGAPKYAIVGVLAGVLGGIALFGVVGVPRGATDATDPRAVISETATRVDETLGELQREWNPVERRRILDLAVAGSGGSLAPEVAQRLVTGDARLAEAIHVAGELADRELLDPLRELWLKGPPEMRPIVLRAIARCGGWQVHELARIAKVDSSIEVRVAAVEVLGRAEPRPLDALLMALGDDESIVRRVALAAIGDQLSAEEVAAVAEFAQQALGHALVGSLRALEGHVDVGLEPFVLDQLVGTDTPVRMAALLALGARDAPLSDTTAVESIAADTYESPGVRALAAYCLERTGSTVSQSPLVWPAAGHPAVGYFFARLAIRAGDVRGVEVLIEIVEQSDRAASELTGSVVREAQQILGRMTGVGPRVAIAKLRSEDATLRGVGKPLPPSRIPAFWTDALSAE